VASARQRVSPQTVHEHISADGSESDDSNETVLTVRGTARSTQERDGRAGTTVTRQEMQERIVRSAPDALRYVPGVSVQQTSHGQASPYVRGVTGQQVLLLFDGIRLNNGIFRQGPNQYFFTVDAQSIERVDVVRGSASVLWGSDAIGGAVLARPVEPRFYHGVRTVSARARAFGRFESADLEPGGRAEAELQFGDRFAVVAGVGYRVAQQLRGGAGGVRGLRNNVLPHVPELEADMATQHGTGFRELTFDGRGVLKIRPGLELVGAVYGYRQYDAPRTDQCPSPDQEPTACLWFEQQFRTLSYLTLRGDPSPEIRELQITAAYQNYHERRRTDRPASMLVNRGVDDLDTLGITARASTRLFVLHQPRSVHVRFRYGMDVWRDSVTSNAEVDFAILPEPFTLARGLYVTGGKYIQGGAFVETELSLFSRLTVRAGLRGAFAGVRSAGQASTTTAAVYREWGAVVARAGLEFRATPWWTLLASIDQGFRPPNLDDLTSRTFTAGGFQFENPKLQPERSVSYELGTRVRTRRVDVDAFGYVTVLDGLMTRTLKTLNECPAGEPNCSGTRTRLQLVNAPEPSYIVGGEASVRLRFGRGFESITNISYAWGQGPNPVDAVGQWLPLTRVPPLQGSAELRWTHALGIYFGAVFRWAADQTRLSISDIHDPRIPPGGTPGYTVFDLRAGWRVSKHLRFNLIVENLFDTAWRVHGSSINQPGRGVLLQAAIGW
jgi:iron complex outermembrane receptor protein/hemoglobin/transferrin/lactoferrin receptor protein